MISAKSVLSARCDLNLNLSLLPPSDVAIDDLAILEQATQCFILFRRDMKKHLD